MDLENLTSRNRIGLRSANSPEFYALRNLLPEADDSALREFAKILARTEHDGARLGIQLARDPKYKIWATRVRHVGQPNNDKNCAVVATLLRGVKSTNLVHAVALAQGNQSALYAFFDNFYTELDRLGREI